jgi:hypothetical protein
MANRLETQMNDPDALSREWQVLLSSAQLELPDKYRSRIEKAFVDPVFDWNRLVALASEHDIGPLVYHTLLRLKCAPRPVPPAFHILKNQYCGNALRNRFLYDELGCVLRAFQKRSKAVVVLKGAALAELVYGDRALRPMADVDLLVHKEDLPEIEACLAELSYVLNENQTRPKAWYYDHYHHLAFRKCVNSSFTLRCEIHWYLERPDRPFAIDIEGVWSRAARATIAGVDVLVLSPEDLLLHLCLHICKHKLTAGLRAFCDISETIRRYSQCLDWQEVRRRAAQWRASSLVWLPLAIVAMFWDTCVPEGVVHALAGGAIDRRLILAAREQILQDRIRGMLFPDFVALRRGPWRTGRADVLRKMFSPTVIARRYGLRPGSTKVYAYYPLRLKDLLFMYGGELIRFIYRGREAMKEADRRSLVESWLSPFDQR